jgi:hypothetical protein
LGSRRGARTISPQCRFMIDIVSQYRLGLIEKDSRLFRASTAVDDLLQQIGIVAARGFNEELAGRGTL